MCVRACGMPLTVEQADMRTARNTFLFLIAAAIGLLQLTRSADAGSVQFCVACTEPAKSYVCNVETPHTFQNDAGLQLFCIVRISKDGGHRSCTVDQSNSGKFSDVIKSYSFAAPEIPDGVKRALAKRRQNSSSGAEQMATPPQRGGEPETLIDMTRGAVGASREGLRTTGGAVGAATNNPMMANIEPRPSRASPAIVPANGWIENLMGRRALRRKHRLSRTVGKNPPALRPGLDLDGALDGPLPAMGPSQGLPVTPEA